ncbi:RHS repeat-associated core domain-containing protein [Pseudomonas carassii]|uniref:RHS repeat-associated core domain-containing protein n=1 Tax=Pseudomonas carassii TaxID=3115855 RepID=UPI0038B69361
MPVRAVRDFRPHWLAKGGDMVRNSSKPIHHPLQVACLLMATDSQRSVFYGALGANSSRRCYAPYGFDPIPDTGIPLSRFTGAFRERHTGLYLLGNGTRGYSPALMRFLSVDSWSPFGEGGLNAYAYCSGDPVNRVDPTGHLSAKPRRLQVVLPSAAEPITPAPTIDVLTLAPGAPAQQVFPTPHAGNEALLANLQATNTTRTNIDAQSPGSANHPQSTAPPLPPRGRRLTRERAEAQRLERDAARQSAQQLLSSLALIPDEHMRNDLHAQIRVLEERAAMLDMQISAWESQDQARTVRR